MSENRAPWTPEPWEIKPERSPMNDFRIGNVGYFGSFVLVPEGRQAEAQRIVACVNTLEGIVDPFVVLEMVGVLRRTSGQGGMMYLEDLIATRALLARIDGGE